MTAQKRGFNLYFALGLALLLVGCATRDPNDKLSTLLRVHLEATSHQVINHQTIGVPRSNPVPIEIEGLCLLTEENVVQARVIDQGGTHSLEIQFNRWAIPLLEHNSSSYQGRRLAIMAQWGAKLENVRWLGAPKMNRKILDGVVTFAPDATLEETYQIATGLNNNARKSKSQIEW